MASGSDECEKAVKKTSSKKEASCSSPYQDFTRIPLNRHRMHRSSVRPFFCCGSQVSLNSITEFKDPPQTVTEKDDNEYEDLTDSDDLADDMASLRVDNGNIYSPLGGEASKPSPSTSRGTIGKRKKTGVIQDKASARKKAWTLKFKGKLHVPRKSRFAGGSDAETSRMPLKSDDMCVCTSYKRAGSIEMTEIIASAAARRGLKMCDLPISVLQHLVPPTPSGAIDSPEARESEGACGVGPVKGKGKARRSASDPETRMENVALQPLPVIANIDELYLTEDMDVRRIKERRLEMENGIEVGQVWVRQNELSQEGPGGSASPETSPTRLVPQARVQQMGGWPLFGAMCLHPSTPSAASLFRSSFDGTGLPVEMGSNLSLSLLHLQQNQSSPPAGVHTQVDYIHFLVPDLDKIVNSSFYWGVMDRYEAEKLIENKPEGTFLLRDSAQEEFLFSVSFRRYGRSLHARIEQWNHNFSFDSHDPGVFATDTVCGLIDHYKDPSCCMFFEPMLTIPLHRTSPFTLQHLARAKICSRIQYDSINQLTLPRSLKEYLRYYHYKQKIRVRRFDTTA